MTLSLTKPAAGTVGWADEINQNWTDLEEYLNERRLPTRYVEGLLVERDNASTTQVVVSPGSCRSSSDEVDIVLAATTTADKDTANAINGFERKTIAVGGGGNPRVSVSNGSAVVTGTSTTFLTSFSPADTPRTLTGTIGTGGGASTTVTGSGSKFLSELAVDDLIGNSGVGYRRVTAIASDTSVTVVSSITISNGSTGLVQEQATIEADGVVKKVNSITSNTSLTASSNYSATTSDIAAYAGSKTSLIFVNVWVVAGASGTGLLLSTQRTQLLSPPSGYDVSARRLGALRNNSIDQLSPARQISDGLTRIWEIENANTSDLLSGGTSTSWATVNPNGLVPPTSRRLRLKVILYRPANANDAYVHTRGRNLGSSSTIRSRAVWGMGSGYATVSNFVDLPCDGAQQFQYCVSNASDASAYIGLIGWVEIL